MNEAITLSRECEVTEIPSGVARLLPAGTEARITQSLGGSYTITSHGSMYRVEEKDADALGISANVSASSSRAAISTEEAVWAELRTVYDPEIPVNIADLGLIYSCVVTSLAVDSKRVEIKMTLTAPGCGMADVLKADVERKLSRLSGVKEVKVEVVFDPPWNAGRMSEAAKLELGLDSDYGQSTSALPMYRPGR